MNKRVRAFESVCLLNAIILCNPIAATAAVIAEAGFSVQRITQDSYDLHVSKALSRVDGVISAKLHADSNMVTVTYDRCKLASKNIEALITQSGFLAEAVFAPKPPNPTPVAAGNGTTLQQLAAIKRNEIERMAADWNLSVPYEYKAFFEAILKNNWKVASNTYQRLLRSGGSARNTPLWQPLLETYGTSDQFDAWQKGNLRAYARDMLAQLPADSIYFGGTDPGRFIVTAYRDVIGKPDAIVLSQNPLCDNNYMSYARWRYGDRIWLPSRQDSNDAFQKYEEDVQAGRIPAGTEEVSFKKGRVSVEGVQGVIMVNGILARMIFEANKGAHDFYVEESYVIAWMYPYLSPCGLLMKINPEPLPSLTPERVAQDRGFWDSIAKTLRDDDDFRRDDAAQRTFAKLRCAIGGLYNYRRMLDEARYAFEQACSLSPALPEANFRLADVYMQQRHYADAAAVIEKYIRADPASTKARPFLAQIRNTEKIDARRIELEALFTKGKGDIHNALELADIYRKLNMDKHLQGITSSVLNNPNVPPRFYLDVARIFSEANDPVNRIDALEKYLAREPSDIQVSIDLAAAQITLGRTQDALRSLNYAMNLGGDPTRQAILADDRFDALRNAPKFKALITPTHFGVSCLLPDVPAETTAK